MKRKIQRYASSIYSSEVICRAISDYRKIAKISLSEQKGYFICSFSDCIVDPDKVVSEFGNYLIELMNSRGEIV